MIWSDTTKPRHVWRLVQHTLILHDLDAFLVFDHFPAAGHIAKIVETLAFQQGGCDDTAIPAAAMT